MLKELQVSDHLYGQLEELKMDGLGILNLKVMLNYLLNLLIKMVHF